MTEILNNVNPKNFGTEAEEVAVNYLKKKNWEIVQKNYHSRHGEIDIICLEKGNLVFVEVKASKPKYKDQLILRVDTVKQRKLHLTAEKFLQDFSIDYNTVRFDVIMLYKTTENLWHIEHLKNAFQVD